MWSVPPALRGMRWSATHGSSARGPSPHNAQTVAAALTLAESRPYVPVLFGGFGWVAQRLVPWTAGLGHMEQVRISTVSSPQLSPTNGRGSGGPPSARLAGCPA